MFDAGEADTAVRATRLRLSFRESAALAASMLYVLTGLAGYVMAEQGDPDAATTALLLVFSMVCMLVAAVLVGRLVKDAKNKEQPQRANVRGGRRADGREPSARVNALRSSRRPGGAGICPDTVAFTSLHFTSRVLIQAPATAPS